jgi:quercetin dioxygenase-like cupin family protein
MNEDRLQELAALNSLGALEAGELRELESQLAHPSDAVAREVAAFNDLTALLALSLAAPRDPPPNLKANILRVIAEIEPKSKPNGPAGQPAAATDGFKFLPVDGQGDWRKLPVPGAWVKLLSIDPDRGYAVVLGKLDPAARYPQHKHIHGEQVYVLSGDLHIGSHKLGPGDFHHADAGTVHGVNYSETGCVILAVISTDDLQAQMA